MRKNRIIDHKNLEDWSDRFVNLRLYKSIWSVFPICKFSLRLHYFNSIEFHVNVNLHMYSNVWAICAIPKHWSGERLWKTCTSVLFNIFLRKNVWENFENLLIQSFQITTVIITYAWFGPSIREKKDVDRFQGLYFFVVYMIGYYQD